MHHEHHVGSSHAEKGNEEKKKECFVCAWPEPVASRAGPVVYAAAEPSEHARVRARPTLY